MLPPGLKALDNWICWKLENRDGKPTKIPINPVTGGNAQSNNPSTWTDFDKARTACVQNKYAGMGFMFSREAGIVGVDVDHCRNPETGELSDQAKEILSTLNSYSEVSPSGSGVHILAKGKLPSGGRRKGSIEMYSEGRFFTITGNVLAGYSDNIEDRTAELACVHSKYIAKNDKRQEGKPLAKVCSPDTSEIIDKAMNSRNGHKFRELYNGNWNGVYRSQSEADAALCSMLAFWCAGDTGKMDSIFRQSGLMRKKWDEKHFSGGETYGQRTLNEAVRNCREFYIPGSQYVPKGKEPEVTLDILSFSDVQEEKVQWLIKPYIPIGKLTNLTGFPGECKTTYALHLSAELSKRGHNVLYQSAEDGVADTLKPRLRQFGADFTKVFCINDQGKTLNFKDERLDEMMRKLHPKLVVFDPIQAFMGAGVDFHRANEVRPVLARLVNLAQQYKCAVILIMHLSKGEKKHSVYSALGSADIPAAARSILLCGRDPNNKSVGGIVHIKSSLAAVGPTIGFTIDENGFRLSGNSDITADVLLNPSKAIDTGNKLQAAKELLIDMLGDGAEVSSLEIQEKAKEAGISRRTLFAAKDELYVRARKIGFKDAKWFWFFEKHYTNV